MKAFVRPQVAVDYLRDVGFPSARTPCSWGCSSGFSRLAITSRHPPRRAGRVFDLSGIAGQVGSRAQPGGKTGGRGEDRSMREDFRPTVTVRLGDDGNPEINIDGTTMQAQQLCVALLAGLAIEISPADPVSFLTGMAISAGNLLNRMETEEDNDNETVS